MSLSHKTFITGAHSSSVDRPSQHRDDRTTIHVTHNGEGQTNHHCNQQLFGECGLHGDVKKPTCD